MEIIRLSRAQEQDAQGVLELTKEAFELYAREVRKKESIAALHETLDDVLRDIREKNVYVCTVDGELMGAVRFALLPGYYIHSISKDSDYIRAFMVNELTEMDEMFDYEKIVQENRK